MAAFILSTCGTSILTNGVDNELRKSIIKYTNKSDWSEIPQEVATELKLHFKKREEELLAATNDDILKLSAELNGLLTWQAQDDYQADKQDVYALLATDTVFGKQTAHIIQSWLEKKGYQVTLIESSGVNTGNLAQFRSGLSGLVQTFIHTLEGYKNSHYKIIFNLTGGFKSLNGFLQAMSTIYADESFYLFEGSKDLLYIPKLPFQFNARETVAKDLRSFRRLSQELPISQEDRQAIPDILLFDIDDEVTLSEWGELLWQSSYKQLYKEKLWPSISERIIYDSKFEESTKKLTEDVLLIVNEHIAELAKYAEGDCQKMTKSLDAKPLQSKKYKDRNLWECDLDAHHRIFMVKQGYSFILESVVDALH